MSELLECALETSVRAGEVVSVTRIARRGTGKRTDVVLYAGDVLPIYPTTVHRTHEGLVHPRLGTLMDRSPMLHQFPTCSVTPCRVGRPINTAGPAVFGAVVVRAGVRSTVGVLRGQRLGEPTRMARRWVGRERCALAVIGMGFFGSRRTESGFEDAVGDGVARLYRQRPFTRAMISTQLASAQKHCQECGYDMTDGYAGKVDTS